MATVVVNDHPLIEDECFEYTNTNVQTGWIVSCDMTTTWCLTHETLISYEIVEAT